MSVQPRGRQNQTKCLKTLEARVGFEPTNGGFAVRSSDAAPMGTIVNQAEYIAVSQRAVPLSSAWFWQVHVTNFPT